MLQSFLIWIVLLLEAGVHGNHHYDEPETVGDGDAPWVASVMRREGGVWQHVCVGALVKPRKVLTSAQCMDAWHNVTHPNHDYRVALGGADRSTGQVVAVNRSVQHTKYSAKNINVPDDIAVLTLASDAVLSSNTVSVIPLRFDYNPKTNDECELYAWPHDAGSEIAQMATEVDSMMPLISTLPSHFHKKAKVAQDMTSHFHKKAKVAVMTSDRQFRTRRSARGLGRRSHTRFTTQKGPFPPEIRMSNRSRSVVRQPVSPLQSGVDCHIRFRQFPGHTACLEAQPGVSAVDIDDELKERIVDMHNIYRASVSPPASNMLRMRWDEELAMLAARWAGTCPDDHDTLNFLPGRFGVGQNLFWAWDYKGDEIPIDVDWAIDEWFIERDDYDFNKPHWDQTMDWDKPTGHYTQMVWAGSYLVGCAVAYCGPDKSEYVVVCNYGPQGNMMGQPQPYEAGTACSACRECVDGGLCDCGDKECGPDKLNPSTCKCDKRTRMSSFSQQLNKLSYHLDDRAETFNELSFYWSIVEEGKRQVQKVVEEGQKQGSKITTEGTNQKSQIITEGEKQYLRLISEGEKQYRRIIKEGQKQYDRLVRKGKRAGLSLVVEGMKQASALVEEGRRSVTILAEQSVLQDL